MTTEAVVALALVQGLTEFLPVSSSGHLLLVRYLWPAVGQPDQAFDAFLHLGTLLAVLVYYWPVWRGIVRGLVVTDVDGRDKRDLLFKLVVATFPAAVIGYLYQEQIGHLFASPVALAISFLFTAACLGVADWYGATRTTKLRAGRQDAFVIGFAQAVALVPGISRSAVTIAAGRARGLSREQAVTFSFLMSAPIIAGAGLVSLIQLLTTHPVSFEHLAVGLLVAFLSGYTAIGLLVRTIKRMSLMPFVIYLVVVGGLLLIFPL